MNVAVAHQLDDFDVQIEHLQKRIEQLNGIIQDLQPKLREYNAAFDAFADDRQKFELLAGIIERLEQLKELGEEQMFWQGVVSDNQIAEHEAKLAEQKKIFEEKILATTKERDRLLREIELHRLEIDHHEDEIIHLRHEQEDAQNEYLVEREMKVIPYRPMDMPWTKKGEDEKHYRKILLIVLLCSLLMSALIPMIHFPIPDKPKQVEIPERLAKFLKKKKPKPKKVRPKQEQPQKQEQKKKPTEAERKQARKKIQNKGVLAFKNNFASLLNDTPEANLGASANLDNRGSQRSARRSMITASANNTSGGINSSNLSRNTGGAGNNMAGVAFSRVSSDIGADVAEDEKLSKGPGPSRTDEEIQIVFDRYKAALYRIYNRELRKDPTLQGKVVLRITIEPDGSVSACKVESSDMKSKALLSKIVARVKRFQFGAKAGVPKVTILYPIDFLPAN